MLTDIRHSGKEFEHESYEPADRHETAFVEYTISSTGLLTGVEMTHLGMLALAQAFKVRAQQWLPERLCVCVCVFVCVCVCLCVPVCVCVCGENPIPLLLGPLTCAVPLDPYSLLCSIPSLIEYLPPHLHWAEFALHRSKGARAGACRRNLRCRPGSVDVPPPWFERLAWLKEEGEECVLSQ